MTFFVRLQADDMEQKQVRSFTSPCGHQTPSFLKKAKTFFFFLLSIKSTNEKRRANRDH